ncbi:MAG: leucyl aminopeptidase family protein [Hyphomicrobium sp.]
MSDTSERTVADVFAEGPDAPSDVPIHLVPAGADLASLGLDARAVAWASAQGFSGVAKKSMLLPDADGQLAGVLLGLGDGLSGEPSGPSDMLLGGLATSLPARTYRLAGRVSNSELAALSWGLGSYRFARYRGASRVAPAAQLRWPEGVNRASVRAAVEAVWTGRDLINTPAQDLGPAELEAAARRLAGAHGARIAVITGNELLARNFPMIHAVGRAHTREPRLIDITWGHESARKITLVGKGITFDTGGLDIKPASGMLIMKKDMGGAATALALGHMIMSEGLNCRLRILIPAAENSISGDAFRPGDILTSRAGITVEIGNTDAEGRLVLADALTLADEEQPDAIYCFATLTGAARTALGPDLPAMFSDDDAFAAALMKRSAEIADPVWRLPLWDGYKRHLDSDIADMNNVWDTPFAGAITAALFLRRFVRNARRFTHFDLYGWRSAPRPLGPKGGEPQTARAVMDALRRELLA